MTAQGQGVIAHLSIDGAAEAIDFYKRALGATEIMRMPADDGKRLMHAELEVNGCRLFIADDFVEYREQCGGGRILPPRVSGSTGISLHLTVPDCDAAVKRATDAGATVLMAPFDAFWGDRYGLVLDPFGHAWSFAHPLPAKQS
jgi:PhnB protein